MAPDEGVSPLPQVRGQIGGKPGLSGRARVRAASYGGAEGPSQITPPN
jgi:hypothetical protein